MEVYRILFTHLSDDGHLGYVHLQALANDASVYLLEYLFLILLGTCLGVELLGHIVITL